MNKFWKILIKYFVQGLLYLVPITITIYIIASMLIYVDNITAPLEEKYIGFQIPGLGLLIIILLITFVGIIGSTFLFKPLLQYLELLINRAPLIKDIYSAIQDLLSAFVGGKKKFNEPVLIKMDTNGMLRIGFITRKNGVEEMGINKDHVVVYLPYSYGIMGTVIIVPKENIIPIDLPSTEVMKFIVSGGVTEVVEKSSIK